jgi:hypothetical protein
MELDFTGWNTALPKACEMPNRAAISDFTGLVDNLCEELREGRIKPSASIDLYNGDEIIILRLYRPGHWQPRPIGAKNRQALGWPALDKAAGQA